MVGDSCCGSARIRDEADRAARCFMTTSIAPVPSDRGSLVLFYGLALGFSWGWWLVMLGMGLRVGPGSSASHLPGLMGPAVAASMVMVWRSGWSGLLAWWRHSLLPGRNGWIGDVLLGVTPLAIGMAVFMVLHLAGRGAPTLDSFSQYPGLPEAWGLLPVFFVALALNGVGEELGWRGFLTPALQARANRFRSTLWVTALWLFWHLPLFWLHTGMAAMVGPALVGWVLGLACGAFVLTWVFTASGRQVWVVALWHVLYNFMVATPVGEGMPAAVISAIVMVWGMVVAWRWRREGA